MNFFFDSYAIIEILKNNPNYEQFRNLIIFTSTINLSEVHHHLINNVREKIARELATRLNIQLLDIGKESAIKAAEFRFQYKKEKLSCIDCIGYVLAKEMSMKFLTGDEKFKNKGNVEFVK